MHSETATLRKDSCLRKAIGATAHSCDCHAYPPMCTEQGCVQSCSARDGSELAPGPAPPVVFASTAGSSRKDAPRTAALAHGIKYEGDALDRLSSALGAHIFPATTESVRLAGRVVRARPDGCNRRANPLDSTVIFEVKCPWSKGMRNQVGSRLELHAKQCLLELAAYPSATCLVFAALCFKPQGSGRHYDSFLSRVNREDAMRALRELDAQGLTECMLDEGTAKDAGEVDAKTALKLGRVADILQRMVDAAVPMPKLSAMRMSEAQGFVPELYEHIPKYLRRYVAHEVRLDGKVAADTERLAALGDCAVRGVPVALFPNFYLRFAGRIALYHYCKQKCPEEADEILARCCFTASTAASTRSKYASMLRHYDSSTGVEALFCKAAAEQGQCAPACDDAGRFAADHRCSKRRRVTGIAAF